MRMPRALSTDLRWRIVWSYIYRQQDIDEVADRFLVCCKTVRRVIDLFLNTGDVVLSENKRGPEKKLSEVEQLALIQVVFDKPGIYLEEIQRSMQDLVGVRVSIGQICTEVKEMGLTRQKLHFIVSRRSEEKRAEFMNEVQCIPASMLVFVDETGSDQREQHRLHGYGLRGITPMNIKFEGRGRRVSAIAAMTTDGIEDVYLVEGSVSGDIFCEYVRNSLLPVLQPFNGSNNKLNVIIDNASIHHVDEVCRLIHSSGALLWFLPPYSPDLNPIEECFHQVKMFIRNNSATFHSLSDPRIVISAAFASVAKEDCCAYINHAGYLM